MERSVAKMDLSRAETEDGFMMIAASQAIDALEKCFAPKKDEKTNEKTPEKEKAPEPEKMESDDAPGTEEEPDEAALQKEVQLLLKQNLNDVKEFQVEVKKEVSDCMTLMRTCADSLKQHERRLQQNEGNIEFLRYQNTKLRADIEELKQQVDNMDPEKNPRGRYQDRCDFM